MNFFPKHVHTLLYFWFVSDNFNYWLFGTSYEDPHIRHGHSNHFPTDRRTAHAPRRAHTPVQDSPREQHRWSPSVQSPTLRLLKHWSSPMHRRRGDQPWTPWRNDSSQKTGSHSQGVTSDCTQSRYSTCRWKQNSESRERVDETREIPQVSEEKTVQTHQTVSSQWTNTMAWKTGQH